MHKSVFVLKNRALKANLDKCIARFNTYIWQNNSNKKILNFYLFLIYISVFQITKQNYQENTKS